MDTIGPFFYDPLEHLAPPEFNKSDLVFVDRNDGSELLRYIVTDSTEDDGVRTVKFIADPTNK